MGLAPRVVVVRDHPARRAVWTAVGVISAAAFGYGCFVLGEYRHASENGQSVIPSADCDETSDLAWFRELDLENVVDAGANEQLRGTIKILGDRIHSLEEEVRFYRRLVAPMESDEGFSIERLDIARTRDPARFAYTLVVTRTPDQDQWIEGDLTIDIVGEEAGRVRSLSLAELSKPRDYPIKFGFLYFEDFNGEITIPGDFLPQEVRVTAQVDTGPRFEKLFEWSVE